MKRRGSLTPAQSKVAPGDGLVVSLLVVLIVGTPAVFSRSVIFSFFIPKLSLLWMTAFAVVLVGFYRILVSGAIEHGPRTLTVASAIFSGALVLTSITSSQPWDAVTGLNGVGAGAVSYGLCLVLLHSTFRLGRRRSVIPLVFAFGAGHVAVTAYALLQSYNWDPIAWGQANVGHTVFSTLGNSNFSAAYIALTLPLVVWIAFGSPFSQAVRVAGGAVVGASCLALIYLNTTQGDVVAVVAVLVLGQWVTLRSQKDWLLASLIVLPVVAALVMPLFLGASGVALPGGVIVFTAACSYLGVRWDRKGPTVPQGETKQVTGRFWPWFAAGTIAVAVAGVLLAGRIAEEIEQGLEGRVDLWKAALSIFRDNPFLGTGLETFFAHFSAHRPLEHAVEWEFVTANSAHSVPLGFLSGGGLVLTAAYLFIVSVIGYFGVQAIRKAEPRQRPLLGAVFTSWIAYHLQSLVSIDVPGLIYTQWILGGVLLAGGTPSALQVWRLQKVEPAERGSRRIGGRQRRGWSGVLVAILLVSLVPLSAPLRANMAAQRAQIAFANSDFETAGREMDRASRLQPRVGLYAEIEAYLYEQNGPLESALEERERAARLQPGYSAAALNAARTAKYLDRLDVAEYWYERAVLIDPYGATVLTEAADLFAKTGSEDRAIELLTAFEDLDSANLGAWQVASAVHAFLGNEEAAGRAEICGIPGQKGCWTSG